MIPTYLIDIWTLSCLISYDSCFWSLCFFMAELKGRDLSHLAFIGAPYWHGFSGYGPESAPWLDRKKQTKLITRWYFPMEISPCFQLDFPCLIWWVFGARVSLILWRDSLVGELWIFRSHFTRGDPYGEFQRDRWWQCTKGWCLYGGFHSHGGTPKWMVYKGNPIKMDDLVVPLWKPPDTRPETDGSVACGSFALCSAFAAKDFLCFERTWTNQTLHHPCFAGQESSEETVRLSGKWSVYVFVHDHLGRKILLLRKGSPSGERRLDEIRWTISKASNDWNVLFIFFFSGALYTMYTDWNILKPIFTLTLLLYSRFWHHDDQQTWDCLNMGHPRFELIVMMFPIYKHW